MFSITFHCIKGTEYLCTEMERPQINSDQINTIMVLKEQAMQYDLRGVVGQICPNRMYSLQLLSRIILVHGQIHV